MHKHDCEHYIPKSLTASIIIVMVFQTVVVSTILIWTTTRWTVSPSDAMKAMQRETDAIDTHLEELTEQVRRHVEQVKK